MERARGLSNQPNIFPTTTHHFSFSTFYEVLGSITKIFKIQQYLQCLCTFVRAPGRTRYHKAFTEIVFCWQISKPSALPGLSCWCWWRNRTRLLRAYSYSFIFLSTSVRGGDSLGNSLWDRCSGPGRCLLLSCWCGGAGWFMFWCRNWGIFFHPVQIVQVGVCLGWGLLGPC